MKKTTEKILAAFKRKLSKFSDKPALTRKKETSLKKILRKLKEREQKLSEKLKNEHNQDHILKLEHEIQVIHKQRQKGLELLKELHREKD
jgi:predicted  nucleic acid-binding Zn-ribbon protein